MFRLASHSPIRPSNEGLTSFSSEKVSARYSLCALTRLFAATQQLARAVTSPGFLRFEFGFQGRQVNQPRQSDPDFVVVHMSSVAPFTKKGSTECTDVSSIRDGYFIHRARIFHPSNLRIRRIAA